MDSFSHSDSVLTPGVQQKRDVGGPVYSPAIVPSLSSETMRQEGDGREREGLKAPVGGRLTLTFKGWRPFVPRASARHISNPATFPCLIHKSYLFLIPPLT
ncbi:hypothetical protein J6590_072358 [Homalodisca vitripennis]|nr:hypothetical protein J6590_072358 [Homalodisca vitripennis]